MGLESGSGSGGGIYSGASNRAKSIFSHDRNATLNEMLNSEPSLFEKFQMLIGAVPPPVAGLNDLKNLVNRNPVPQQSKPKLNPELDDPSRLSDQARARDTGSSRGQRLNEVPRARLPKFQGRRGGENDLMGYLDDYLAEKMSAQGATFDYEKALRDSEQAIRRAYRNDINAIQGQNKRARKDTAANRKEVEQLYNVLAKNFQKEQGEALAQGEQLAGMMQEISQGAASNVQDLVSQLAAEQNELAQGLGIEAALPSMGEDQIPQATTDITGILGEGAEDANRMLGFAGNQMQWLQSGETGSRMEGANRSTELLRDMQDFIQGNRDKISGLRGQRGREIAGNKDDIMAAVAEMQANADEQLWDQLTKYAEMKLDVENTQFDNDLALKKYRSGIKQDNIENKQWAKEFGLDKALAMQPGGGSEVDSGLPGFMEDAMIHIQQMNPKAQGVIGDVLSSDQFADGRITAKGDGSTININPTMAANIAEREARRQGITNPSQLNLIRLAAMAYASGGI